MKARDSQPLFEVINRTKNSSEAQATLLVWHMLKQSLHKSPQKQHKQTLSSLNMCFALNRPGVNLYRERLGKSVEEMRFPIFPYFTRYSSMNDFLAGGTRDEALRRSAWEAMIVQAMRHSG